MFILLTSFLLTIVEAIVLGIWYPVEYPILPGLFIIGTIIPSFAVGARRLHDIDNTRLVAIAYCHSWRFRSGLDSVIFYVGYTGEN